MPREVFPALTFYGSRVDGKEEKGCTIAARSAADDHAPSIVHLTGRESDLLLDAIHSMFEALMQVGRMYPGPAPEHAEYLEAQTLREPA